MLLSAECWRDYWSCLVSGCCVSAGRPAVQRAVRVRVENVRYTVLRPVSVPRLGEYHYWQSFCQALRHHQPARRLRSYDFRQGTVSLLATDICVKQPISFSTKLLCYRINNFMTVNDNNGKVHVSKFTASELERDVVKHPGRGISHLFRLG